MALPSILIVEDEFLIRLTLSEALGDEGYEVFEASTAEEGLAQITGQAGIGLMMTDIQLHGAMNGLDLARRARETRPDLPIIYVSGRPDVLNTVGQSDKDVIIMKPYLPSDIVAAVRRLIG